MKHKKGTLLILSGPSGVGKSTLVGRVRQEFPDMRFSVSCTTRAPRGEEKHGVEYYFISSEEFERKAANNEFLEYAGVHARRYGTLYSEVFSHIDAGYDCILDIDVQGAMQIREKCARQEELAAVCEFVFIGPPSFAELERRLRGRGTDGEEQIALRLKTARQELDCFKKYDYLVINDKIETAAAELCGLIRSFALRTPRYENGVFYGEE